MLTVSLKFPRFLLLTLFRSRYVLSVWAFCACLIGGAAVAAPGDLDPTFGVLGNVSITLFGADDPQCIQGCFLSGGDAVTAPLNKYLVSGTCQLALNSATNTHNICVARFFYDGSLDVTFGNGGWVVVRNQTVAGARTIIALHGDGSIFVGASCYFPGGQRVCLTKLNSTGAVDALFGASGTAYASPSETFGSAVIDRSADIRLSADGKITLLAYCVGNQSFPTNHCLLRFNSSGALDTAFGTGGYVSTRFSYGDDAKIVSQLDGKQLVVSSCQGRYLCVEKYLSNWQYDTAFGATGAVVVSIGPDVTSFSMRDIQLDTNERANVVGICSDASGGTNTCALRINADATLDSTFGSGGRVLISRQAGDNSEIPNSILVQNGKIFVGSTCQSANRYDMCVRGFDSAGKPLGNFGRNGIVRLSFGTYSESVYKLLVAVNDKVFVAGACYVSSGDNLCLARLKGGPYDATNCELNSDANSEVGGNDGLLAVRYLLGYRGDALTAGAVGASPGRSNAQIETHLASLNLDADGDGQVNAMTDGLLILRALLGLSGDALTVGAVNASHPNVRNAQQILKWIEITHGVACLP